MLPEMSPSAHKVYVATMTLIVMAALLYLIKSGFDYYLTPLEERFYHPDYDALKPSGAWGHALGIFGSLSTLIGVSVYMIRKRMRSLARLGRLKHWLEFHIFLCVLGPVLILFHTSFKFGGLVSVSFWSMVAVFLSGIVGRFIYIRIPRTIEGREMGLNEIMAMKKDFGDFLEKEIALDPDSRETILESLRIKGYPDHFEENSRTWPKRRGDRLKIRRIRAALRKINLKGKQRSGIVRFVKNEIVLHRRIERLVSMQKLFKYWHVAHLPFALVMLIIMIIHVVVALIFGYQWIF